MKIIAAVFADFTETFLGGPSQLATRIGSRSILAHALARLERVTGLDERCLVVRSADLDRAKDVIANIDAGAINVLTSDVPRPRRRLIRSARKWNLESWRGGPLGTTYFDEFVEPAAVAGVLDSQNADAVLCLDGHQPALDPG